jgi:uncharacterized membrane protein
MERTLQSKARIGGHPIHPMLVHFPIALFVGGLLALIAFAAIGDLFWYRAASVAFIAGAVTAVLAAIAGAIDLYGSIPPESPARSTGVKHMGLNMAALVIFGAVGIMMRESLRMHVNQPLNELSLTLPLVLAFVGAGLLAVSGTLGSKLVHIHGVGKQIAPPEAPGKRMPDSGTVATDARRPAY